MERIKLDLIIEREETSDLWGRVIYNDNLLADTASTVQELEQNIKILLHDFEGLSIEQIEFNHLFDVYALFKKFDYLNITKIAKHAGINPGLLRQYASGIKSPSKEQAKKIETILHQLATELKNARIFVG